MRLRIRIDDPALERHLSALSPGQRGEEALRLLSVGMDCSVHLGRIAAVLERLGGPGAGPPAGPGSAREPVAIPLPTGPTPGPGGGPGATGPDGGPQPGPADAVTASGSTPDGGPGGGPEPGPVVPAEKITNAKQARLLAATGEERWG